MPHFSFIYQSLQHGTQLTVKDCQCRASCCWDTVFFWINSTPYIPLLCPDRLGPLSLGGVLGTLVKAINLGTVVDSVTG